MGECAEGGGTAGRDREAGKDSIACGRIRDRGFLWALVGSHVTFPHVLHPPHPKIPPIPTCHHLHTTPTNAQGSCTWSFCSCSEKIKVGTRNPLSSCTRGSRGSYPHWHDTSLPAVWGIKRVNKCQVKGCSEGPSTSCATICVHVHKDHLEVSLVCPSCCKTFFNLDALRH